ncbi:ABC transporter substrate-binding protein [Sphingomonas sp. ID1715]|uniref:ABC transporter substrate-binding protein n=1 Tax=Sphingomonas sp. ID1715 TaxID=1656898 RepID=UPI00148910EB|nr:ABC transporter substrate-binding protein [Sphingomonas sp. ID1715]NNM75722.1 ABC transporter substrate-binding protein [Sphingomonas sp. ID1715]
MKHRLLSLVPIIMLAACGGSEPEGPIRVSVIGGPPTLVDPNRKAPDATQQALLGAVAEPLVTYDETGQVAPALAQRWIVTSDGLSAIFRLRRAAWSSGSEVTSQDVARRMRAMLAPASRNPLRIAFDSIEEINPTTPDVIEFRLTTPRPPLFELLAQPEAVMLSRSLEGTGPFRIAERQGDMLRLKPREAAPGGAPAAADHDIELRGERAARAIVRFTRGEADLVLGGTYADWPLIAFAKPQNRAVRLDPAEGLFGLLVQNADGFLADPIKRQALAMAIDRDAMLAALDAPGWTGVLAVLPQRYRSAADPALPLWAALDIAGRIEEARRRVAAWRAAHPEGVTVRLFLPDGPGSTLLYGRLAADWRRIGVETIRTGANEADLRLVDRVAPAGSALWYLATIACPARTACAEDAVAALDAARKSQSLAERGVQLATADRAIADAGFWVPLARPLRWSLVSPRLNLFKENARALHPLTRLHDERR